MIINFIRRELKENSTYLFEICFRRNSEAGEESSRDNNVDRVTKFSFESCLLLDQFMNRDFSVIRNAGSVNPGWLVLETNDEVPVHFFLLPNQGSY